MSVQLNDVFLSTVRWLTDQGHPHQALMLCESTSSLAKANAFTTPSNFVYISAQQTHGRGRSDNTWSSPAQGAGLMATWSWSVNKAPQHLTAPLIGLSVYRALMATWPDLLWSLKPPNDLFLGKGKIGGLLVETISRGDSHTLLIGFGLNILNVPQHIPHATCLADQIKGKITENDWFSFLKFLHQGFSDAVRDCHQHQLSFSLRAELLTAIRRHPHYKELQGVSEDGDLIFADRTIDWYSL